MSEIIEAAVQETERARKAIERAAEMLADSMHTDPMGVLTNPADALLALQTAQTYIAEAMKIVTSTQWPREVDYE